MNHNDLRPNYQPTLDKVRSITEPYTVVPIYREVRADLETPVSAYLKVAQDDEYSFLLESVEGGERQGRYSFIGSDPYKTHIGHQGAVSYTHLTLPTKA